MIELEHGIFLVSYMPRAYVIKSLSKDLAPSNVWQKVFENDTFPEGMFVKMDLNTAVKSGQRSQKGRLQSELFDRRS